MSDMDDILIDDPIGGGGNTGDRETDHTDAAITARYYAERKRSYIRVYGGMLRLGVRNLTTNVMNDRITFTPSTAYIGGTSYKGYTCNANKLDIRTGKLRFRMKGTMPFTGRMRVVTNITTATALDDLRWTFESIPFVCGFCVGDI